MIAPSSGGADPDFRLLLVICLSHFFLQKQRQEDSDDIEQQEDIIYINEEVLLGTNSAITIVKMKIILWKISLGKCRKYLIWIPIAPLLMPASANIARKGTCKFR